MVGNQRGDPQKPLRFEAMAKIGECAVQNAYITSVSDDKAEAPPLKHSVYFFSPLVPRVCKLIENQIRVGL